MNDFRITVVSPDRQQLDGIVRTLQTTVGSVSISAVEGTLQRLGALANQPIPDILVVDSKSEGDDDLRMLEQLGQMYPNIAFVLLSRQQTPEFLIKAMRAGVREVLPSPVDAGTLEATIGRISNKLGLGASKDGKVFAFISCKGGSGATFLATNLAYALAAEGDNKVALFDLNLQFGDALLFLTEQKPVATIADVVRGIHRLDPAFLASSMVNVAPNLAVLAASEDPAHSMEIKPDHIDVLLKMARKQYDFVILDVGRTLGAQTIKALDHADTIFPVLQLTLPFIRAGKRLLEVFQTLDYQGSKINLVVNRHEKGADFPIGDLEKALGADVTRIIPNHYQAAAASVNQGEPIAKLVPGSPVTKALTEWSAQLQSKPEQENSSWISRVFKRA